MAVKIQYDKFKPISIKWIKRSLKKGNTNDMDLFLLKSHDLLNLILLLNYSQTTDIMIYTNKIKQIIIKVFTDII